MADVPAWIRADNRKTGNSLQGPSSMNAKITGNGISSMNSKISRPTVQNYADGGMVKGYADGKIVNQNPYQGDDVDPYSGARNEDGSIRKDETPAPSSSKMDMGDFEGLDDAIAKNKADDAARAESAPKKMSFGEAFKSAKDGSTFEWEGKKYKKEYAQPKAAPKVEPKAESKPAPQPEPPKADTEQKKASGMGPTNTMRPDPKAPSIYAGQKAWGQYRMRQGADRDQTNQSSAEVERLIRQNEAKKPTPRGRGVIDTSNIDSKTLLPRR